MNFRRKLLMVFALTVFLSVTAVTLIVSSITRRAFEQADDERTAALVARFEREFNRKGEEVVRRVRAIAGSDQAARMALAVNRGSPDYGAYLAEAKTVAEEQQLDFLEFVDDQGTIISSAQWPAKFGYKESALPAAPLPIGTFLRREEVPDGSALALAAIGGVPLADKQLYVIGGQNLDKNFLASLELSPGMRAMLYQNVASGFEPQFVIDASGTVQQPKLLAPLIQQVQQTRREAGSIIHWDSDAAHDESIRALPLNGLNSQLVGVLLVGNSRQPYVELQRRIRSAAFFTGGAGILVAVLLSGWAAARVTRPVERLAEAARAVAGGNWNTQVSVTSTDELGELAESFNRMTHELLEQKERLVQTERVAAWRELARRLAHELRNPLFPLQLTVENLVRARDQSPEQFEEVFRESSSTLLAEIANLKTIISRFSEFSKMPQPKFQRIDVNVVVQDVARLFKAQMGSTENKSIECRLELSEALGPVAADAELLHRALSNLVLNAMDVMPQGGTLTLRTRQEGNRAFVEISDTGTGLTPEECDRIFTPYYTSKTHGTGLGLAIVQSVVSDHGGRISVRSQSGNGTTFVIELPRNLEKAIAHAARADASSTVH
jgi:two-component system nitrogen regulation sensor histidine kinase NtrY